MKNLYLLSLLHLFFLHGMIIRPSSSGNILIGDKTWKFRREGMTPNFHYRSLYGITIYLSFFVNFHEKGLAVIIIPCNR
ncbi:hypothetical protein GLYMA_16G053850v4 [Glycine max]|nr:hypothetical protein GLYMA_16G053850v4 [Glycine max]KAH1150086.1 hypothetical protein GYH30_044226 [Glycine max]